MSVYAILGATGQFGGSILEVLARQPEATIHCFVRSTARLNSKYPKICSSANVQVFEGDISNIVMLADCLRGTRAAFLTVAETLSRPGIRIAQDQAEAVVGALQQLQKEKDHVKLPVLVMLSSSGAEIEPKFSLGVPWPARKLLWAALYYIYTDLIEAERYLRTQDWLDVVYFKPGGTSHDIQRGHELSEVDHQTFVSFLDVAAGMVECANEPERWGGKCVSVLSRGKAKPELGNWKDLLKGLLVYLVPGLASWLY